MSDDPATGDDLSKVFVMLTDSTVATPVPVGPAFWDETIKNLPPGWLVSKFTMADDWAHWEMHPAGDEVLLQISGAAELIFDGDGGETRRRLSAGEFAVVPRGTWHTADVIEAGQVLFITSGQGTEHRPR